MRPLESPGRWCALGVIAALLCLPHFSAGAEVTRPVRQKAQPMLSSDAAMQVTPSVMDRVPRVHCCDRYDVILVHRDGSVGVYRFCL